MPRPLEAAFVRGTSGQLRANPAPGNVFGGTGPHRIDGDWRTRRRGALPRAFLAADAGALSWISRKSS
jgi:hypothetical protein